jgi:hypothetical protein
LSRYSPTYLREVLPRQPVPNDLPEGLDASIFTFEDAFEDLLAVSQGQPLPDIHRRYEQRKLLRDMFPNGEPTWFYARRLQAFNLIGPPPQQQQLAHHSVAAGSNWEELHAVLDRLADEAWGRIRSPPPRMDPGLFEAKMKELEEISEGLGRQANILKSIVEEKTQYDPWRKSAPDHFDDLFSTLRDWAETGRRSWDAFMREFNKNSPDAWEDKRPKNADSDIKVEESRDERVDEYGYVHSTVTRRELDSQGNEVSRTTHYEMYPSRGRRPENHGRLEASEESDKRMTDYDEGEETTKKKIGWFWK